MIFNATLNDTTFLCITISNGYSGKINLSKVFLFGKTFQTARNLIPKSHFFKHCVFLWMIHFKENITQNTDVVRMGYTLFYSLVQIHHLFFINVWFEVGVLKIIYDWKPRKWDKLSYSTQFDDSHLCSWKGLEFILNSRGWHWILIRKCGWALDQVMMGISLWILQGITSKWDLNLSILTVLLWPIG